MNRFKALLWLLLFSVLFPINCWGDNTSFLTKTQQIPASKAFVLSIPAITKTQVIARWTIAPSFMLYQHRIHIRSTDNSHAAIGAPWIPANDSIQQTLIDGMPVFERSATAYIPIKSVGNGKLQLSIQYQGCKGRTYCYPPVNKRVDINLNTQTARITDAPPQPLAQAQSATSNTYFHHKNLIWVILSFLGFGLLLSFTPCVFPMLPILWSIIVGKDRHTRHTLFLASLYILSMAITFAILGVFAAYAGHTLQAALQNIWVIALFDVILVLLALSLFGVYEFRLPRFIQNKIQSINQHQKSGSIAGAIVMGALSTLIVSPCVSAPLAGALIYIGNTGNALLGGLALFALAIGMGLPLMLICLAGNKALPKTGVWMVTVQRLFGVMLLGLAIWLMGRVTPGPIILWLYAFLFIVTAIYLGLINVKKRWPLVKRIIALIFLFYGATLMMGAFHGHSNPLNPWEKTYTGVKFQTVDNRSQLNAALDRAKQKKKAVILEFYAKWCIACQTMKQTVFTHSSIKKALHPFVRLRVDLTHNTQNALIMAKAFHVYAPPSFVFFNRDGVELSKLQLFGETDSASLLRYIQLVNKKTP
jgi:thioredoxin:protein disulfide reductase